MAQITVDQIRELIAQKRYLEARQLLIKSNHPKRAEWLTKIDALIQEQSLTSSKPTQLMNIDKPHVHDSVFFSMQHDPKPLIVDDAPRIFGDNQPKHPKQLIASDMGVSGRLYGAFVIFGVKVSPLIFNFFRIRRPIYGLISFSIYVSLLLMWIPAFYIFFTTWISLVKTGTTNFLGICFSTALLIGLPLFPYLLAWIQEPVYDYWVTHRDID
jgi:hypothetical protein